MRKFALMLVSTAGLMVLGNVAALADGASGTTDPAQAAAAPAGDPDKIVCRSMDPPTGSRLGSRRECKTQREWDDIQRQARQQTEHQQSNGYRAGVPGG